MSKPANSQAPKSGLTDVQCQIPDLLWYSPGLMNRFPCPAHLSLMHLHPHGVCVQRSPALEHHGVKQ